VPRGCLLRRGAVRRHAGIRIAYVRAGRVVLVLAGGILYSLGAVIYACKRPDPSPRWSGFHEVFHAMTIAAYLTHYAAVSLVVYRAA
jgi:channel protein (hemolysin III family)